MSKALYKKHFTTKGGKLYWKNSKGRKAAGSEAGTNHGDGYKTVRIDGKAHYVHRVIKTMTSKKTVQKEVDHKNRKRSDNRPSNLRLSTRTQNNKNRGKFKKK